MRNCNPRAVGWHLEGPWHLLVTSLALDLVRNLVSRELRWRVRKQGM